jgi:hypothetical protein
MLDNWWRTMTTITTAHLTRALQNPTTSLWKPPAHIPNLQGRHQALLDDITLKAS